jgi:serine/threonine protein phosphatase PrpC
MRSKTATHAEAPKPALKSFGAQIQGKRATQEDAWAIEKLDDGSILALVADGLGGHPHGERASAEAVAEFCRVFVDQHVTAHGAAKRWMQKAVVEADRHLHALQRHHPELHGMATTLVGLYVRGDKMWALSVGDSYVLLLRKGQLVRLNELHEEGGGITSTLGYHLTQVELDDEKAAEPGDRYVLASDGIVTLKDEEVQEVLAAAADPKAAVTALLARVEARENPSQDNTTAVAIFV